MPVEERDRQIAGGASDDAAAAARAAKAKEAREQGLYIPEDFLDNPLGQDGEPGFLESPENPIATNASAPTAASRAGDSLSENQANRLGRMRSLADRAGAQFRGLSGNRRVVAAVLGGGGIIGIMIALFLTFAQFKLIHMMENMASHLFSRNQYMFEARRDIYMREFYNNYLGQPDRAIDDSTASLSQQVMRRMKDGLEPRLKEKYDIKIEADRDNIGYKKLTFTDKQSGEVTKFSTATDKAKAREFNKKIAKEITKDDGWVKRIWYKGRMTRVTGTKWNWLDPIKQPYNKAKVAAANQVAKFLLSGQSKASGVRTKVISKIFGDTGTGIEDNINSEIETAAGDDAEKILSQKITSAATKGLNAVGLAVIAVQISCTIDDFLNDDPLKKLVRQKMEIEYMTQYAAMISKSSQLKLGKTDGNTVNAHMAMMTYTDKNGKSHDVAESNNYRRATGEKIAYQPNENCNDYTELCEAKLPGKAISDNAIAGNFLALSSGASSVYNSTAYQVIAKVVPLPGLPGSLTTEAVCWGWDHGGSAAANLGGEAVDAALSRLPLVSVAWNKLKSVAGDALGALSEAFIGWMSVTVVDADTTGPFLANATAAGGSLAAASAAGSPVGTDDTGDESKACYNKSPDERAEDDSFCGKPLSRDQVAVLDRKIAEENYNDFKNSPLTTKVASLDTPYSLASRLIDATPTSPQTLADRSNDMMIAAINPKSWMKAIQNLPNLLVAPALATQGQESLIVKSDGTDQFNTRIHGFTDDELQKPLDSPGLENIDRNTGCSIIAGLTDKDRNPIDLPEKCINDITSSTGGEPTEGVDKGPVVLIGDSIMKGTDEIGKIGEKLNGAGWPATIDGVVSRTIGGGATAIQNQKQAIEGAKLVVLELGTNPGGNIDISNFKTDIRKRISEVQAINSDATIAWVNIISKSSSQYDERNNAIKQVANDKGALYFDLESDNIPLSGDEIHPTTDGYEKYSQKLYDKIIKAGSSGESSGNLSWPLPSQYGLSSCWNTFRAYYNGGAGGGHSGLDIAAPEGVPVKAADGGTVVLVKDNGGTGYGKVIIIKHSDGLYTLYGHLSAFNTTQGKKVGKGSIIGKVGNTGSSRGAHLHFNVQTKSYELAVASQTKNPLDYLPEDPDRAMNGCKKGPEGHN